MNRLPAIFVAFSVCFFCVPKVSADSQTIDRGRYLTVIAGCNDCHTAGFAASGGKIPEKDWLLGDPVGWKGDWGTTYAINLRKLVSPMTKENWISYCRSSKARPPMPTYAINRMKEQDLSDIYDFLKSLGDAGSAMPAVVPPGVEPKTPYFNLTPLNMPDTAKE